jgi:hypothetical protein
MLDDPVFVWLVGTGKVSVFLTALAPDNMPGSKIFCLKPDRVNCFLA